jgi:hypothetical protein
MWQSPLTIPRQFSVIIRNGLRYLVLIPHPSSLACSVGRLHCSILTDKGKKAFIEAVASGVPYASYLWRSLIFVRYTNSEPF